MPIHAHQLRPFGRPAHTPLVFAFVGKLHSGWGHSLSDRLTVVKQTFSGSGSLFEATHRNL